MLSSLLAIGWKPEIHGVVIIIIAVLALPGTVYLLVGTNLGARLGLLVSLAGLFGWVATIGLGALLGAWLRQPIWKPAACWTRWMPPCMQTSVAPRSQASRTRRWISSGAWRRERSSCSPACTATCTGRTGSFAKAGRTRNRCGCRCSWPGG